MAAAPGRSGRIFRKTCQARLAPNACRGSGFVLLLGCSPSPTFVGGRQRLTHVETGMGGLLPGGATFVREGQTNRHRAFLGFLGKYAFWVALRLIGRCTVGTLPFFYLPLPRVCFRSCCCFCSGACFRSSENNSLDFLSYASSIFFIS